MKLSESPYTPLEACVLKNALDKHLSGRKPLIQVYRGAKALEILHRWMRRFKLLQGQAMQS